MKSDRQKINALAIRLQGRRIGIINRLAGDRHLFSFEQDYIDNPRRPTLSLSFKGQAGGLVTNPRLVNVLLPPFFSNVLPEGHLRTYLAQRADIKPEREFFLLAALGADLPGAITAAALEMEEHVGEYPAEYEDSQKDSSLHFSLAGIQLKFSAIMESSGGLTIPANGMDGSWIIKLPSNRFPSVTENEFVMLSLAQAIGIHLPQHQLINVNAINGLPEDAGFIEGKALAIKRFDRSPDGKRIHMEDFAQVFGLFPDDKYKKRSYANIASVLWAETGEAGTYEFLRRLIFSVLIGNADMHLKNWSLLYPDARTPVLSPAYDLVSTIPYIQDDELALSFGDSRSLSEVSPDQIRRFADSARIPVSPLAQLVLETIERTMTAWSTLEQKEILPSDLRKSIDTQIKTVATNTLRLWK